VICSGIVEVDGPLHQPLLQPAGVESRFGCGGPEIAVT
jgi:hypothetical protein